MAKVPHGVEILPKISIVWVGCTNVTDDRRQTDDRQTDRQTDGPSMTNSEHELEFTFANKMDKIVNTSIHTVSRFVEQMQSACRGFCSWIVLCAICLLPIFNISPRSPVKNVNPAFTSCVRYLQRNSCFPCVRVKVPENLTRHDLHASQLQRQNSDHVDCEVVTWLIFSGSRRLWCCGTKGTSILSKF